MKKAVLIIIIVVGLCILSAIGILLYNHFSSVGGADISIFNTTTLNLTTTSDFTFKKADKVSNWISSDTSILEVKDGKLTPKKIGSATVTGFDKGGKEYSCTVNIYPLRVEKNGSGCYTVAGAAGTSMDLITEIYIPSYIEGIPVTEIAPFAFNFYKTINKVTIEKGVTKIGAAAFANCISLGSIEIPDSVKVLADNIFKGCTSLKTIILPDSIESIGKYFIEGCSEMRLINYRGSYAQWSKIKIADDFPSDLQIVYNYKL